MTLVVYDFEIGVGSFQLSMWERRSNSLLGSAHIASVGAQVGVRKPWMRLSRQDARRATTFTARGTRRRTGLWRFVAKEAH
jgi:hypothetical protein